MTHVKWSKFWSFGKCGSHNAKYLIPSLSWTLRVEIGFLEVEGVYLLWSVDLDQIPGNINPPSVMLIGQTNIPHIRGPLSPIH